MPIKEIVQHREIDIAVASIDLAGAEIAMSTQIGRERSLQKALAQVSDDYDFVCIDTPPSLGLLTINALTAADKVIVPVQCEYLSMRGLVQLQNTLEMIRENLNPDVQIEGILPTMLDTRTIHAKEAVEILEENFGELVFKSRIKKAIKFAEAPVKGSSVLKYDPQSNAAQCYRDLAEEVLTHGATLSGQACARVPSPTCSGRPRQPDDPPEPPEQPASRTARAEPEAEPPRAEPPARARAGARGRRAEPRRGRRARPRRPAKDRLRDVFSQRPGRSRARLRPRRALPHPRDRTAGGQRPGDPRHRRRRRWRQRRQPHGRGRDHRRRVHGRQHRPAVAAAERRRPDRSTSAAASPAASAPAPTPSSATAPPSRSRTGSSGC